MRTLITGGTLVTAEVAAPMEVLIQDEKVAALAAGFSGLSAAWRETADLHDHFSIAGRANPHVLEGISVRKMAFVRIRGTRQCPRRREDGLR